MSVLTAITAARRELNTHMLPDSCAVQSLIGATSDGAGGTTGGTWTTQVTVDCQVTTSRGTANGQETITADGITEVVDADIVVPAGTAVTAPQRVVHTESATSAVTTYGVLAVSKPTRLELLRTIKAQVVTA